MKWYYDLGMRIKLILNFSVVIFLTLIIALLALLSMQQARSVADYMQTSLGSSYVRTDTALESTIHLREAVSLFIENYHNDSSTLTQLERSLSNFNRDIGVLQGRVFVNEVRIAKESATALERLSSDKLRNLILQGDFEQAIRVHVQEATPLFRTIFEQLNTIRDSQIAESVRLASEVSHQNGNNQGFLA